LRKKSFGTKSGMTQQCAVFQFAWSPPWSLYPSPPPPSNRQKMHRVDQIFWNCLLNLLGTVHLNTARELPAKTCLTPHTIVFQKWKTKTKSGSLRQTAAGKSFFLHICLKKPPTQLSFSVEQFFQKRTESFDVYLLMYKYRPVFLYPHAHTRHNSDTHIL